MNKKLLSVVFAFAMVMTTTATQAQEYRNSKYYNPETGRLDYSNKQGYNGGRYSDRFCMYGFNDSYFGVRLGLALSSVSSDSKDLDGSSTKTGLNLGFVVGATVTNRAPLYFETGLGYVEKGGKGQHDGHNFTYNLNYIEMPLTFKYIHSIDDHISVQPHIGGYLSLGVGGKIKDYGEKQAYSAFGRDNACFQRFDGGLKIGCGVGYDMFYADINYDLGLSNIGHGDFDNTRNSALTLNIGLNF